MKLLSVLALATGFTSALANNIPFTLCEKGDAVTIKDISTDKVPAPGETLHLTATGSSSIAITDGTYDLTIKALGITFVQKSGDLCTDEYVKIKCPVAAGTEVDVSGVFDLPKNLPKMKFDIELHAKDSAGDKLFCADMTVDLSQAATEVAEESVPMVIADSFVGAATTHYEDPKPSGCESGEMAIQILGVAGDFCSPKCSATSPCPSDVPTGTLASPQCVLAAQGSASPTNCALICSASEKCPTGASCKSISGTGICTYDD